MILAVGKNGTIDLQSFSSYIKIKQVHSYVLESLEDGNFIVRFYNKKGILIPAKEVKRKIK